MVSAETSTSTKSNNVEIIKSPNDIRDYRYLKLDNEMEVVLVSDTEIDNSSVCLRVGVGSFSNPSDALGLAHFLEHMLFMGTEKYPVEKEFAEFIHNNGGSYNAGTSSIYTNYYYNINQTSLKESLDRLSSFFICPLMNDSSTQREINAINSEHNGNIQNDIWRVSNLRGKAFPDHPMSRFSTGTHETLNKPGMRDRVVEFYNTHYSSNLLKLCIVGPQSLDTLEQWVREYFTPIKNKNIPEPTFPPMKLDKTVFMNFVPIMNKATLRMEWPISDPAFSPKDNYRKHTSEIISNLLGHESNGSLFSLLKKKNYAFSLSCGPASTSRTEFAIFVEIDLSELGFENIDEIIALTFQFIKLLSDIPQYVVQETISENHIVWNNAAKARALEYSKYITEILSKVDKPENTLKYKYICDQIDLGAIREVTQKYMTPDNMLVMVGSEKFKGKTNLVADHYGTEYSYVDVTTERLESWRSGFPTNQDLFIPAPNKFIPTKFDIKHKQTPEVELQEPALIYNKDGVELYHSPDTRFNTPMAHTRVKFGTSHFGTVSSVVCMTLFRKVIKDILNEDCLYDMALGGARYRAISYQQHVEIIVSSFDDKMFVVLEKLFQVMYAFDCTEDCFNRALEKTANRYVNDQLLLPYQIATKDSSIYLSTNCAPEAEKISFLATITREHFIEWVRAYFRKINFTFFIFGNVTKQECIDFCENTVSKLQRNALAPLDIAKLRKVLLPKGVEYQSRRYLADKNQVNCALLTTVQIGVQNLKDICIASVLSSIVRSAFFDDLRTKQQLGYVVHAQCAMDYNIAFRFIVQSSVCAPHLIVEKIKEFFPTLIDAIEQHRKEFKNLIDSTKELMTRRTQNQAEAISIFWDSFNQYNQFNFNNKVAEYLDNITIDHLLEFVKKHFINQSERRMHSSLLYPESFEIPSNNNNSEIIIVDDYVKFKLESILLPSLQNPTSLIQN